VNDPQGLAIHGGLHHLEFEAVESVRAGQYLEFRLDELDEGAHASY
jgi:phosphoribosylformylglycinamidine (FGAM) synthase PurS component